MVRIITDSAADFEPRELREQNIQCIGLSVMFGEECYQENRNLSKDQFYSLLLSHPQPPKTAQASPQVLLELFQEALAAGDEAVYFTISSGISGTYQTAMSARTLLEGEGCYVVDTLNATGGQRMLVEYAVRLRDEGKNARQIVEAVQAMRSRVVLYACIDTLEYLYRGGRISRTVYTLGNLAQIKPIIHVDEVGGISVPARAMGARKGMDMLCKRVEQLPPCGDFPFYVMYTDQKSAGEKLAQRLRAMGIDVPESRIIQVGAAIGAHVGPNACGYVYIQ